MTRPELATVLRTLGACRESLAWAADYGAGWERALAECPDRRWMTWLAGALMCRGHMRREVIVLCACACARTALRYVPAGEERPLAAIETAERWCRGDATLDEVRAARRGAAYAAYASAYAAYAAAYADAYADAAYDARRAARERAEADLRAITRRELGAALLDGLAAYAEACREPGGDGGRVSRPDARRV